MTLTEAIDSVRADGRTKNIKCPAHDDRSPSCSISLNADRNILIHCHSGCATEDILATAGLDLKDLYEPSHIVQPTPRRTARLGPVVATYLYHDTKGALQYRVQRHEPKTFRQHKYLGDDKWATSLGDAQPLVYRLHEIKGPSTFIVEGEKDVDTVRALGLPATCNSGGAGKWTDALTQQLVAAGVNKVCIIPDRDEPGQKHAESVAGFCTAAGIEVRILTLDQGKDVSDWVEGQGDEEQRRRAAALGAWRDVYVGRGWTHCHLV